MTDKTTEKTEQETKRPLSLARAGGRLELRKPIETGQVRQSFPHGRSKTVQVEVRKKRAAAPGVGEPAAAAAPVKEGAPAASAAPAAPQPQQRRGMVLPHGLTPEERAHRARALKGAIKADEVARQAAIDADRQREEEERRAEAAAAVRAEEERTVEARHKVEEDDRRRVEDERRKAEKAEEDSRREVAERAGKAAAAKVAALTAAGKVKVVEEEEEEAPAKRGLRAEVKKAPTPARRDEPRRRTGKLTITKVLNEGDEERQRSLASLRRHREREKQRALQQLQEQTKIVRDVVVPEHITVQELANRMAERSADVIKTLMRMGVMATINQAIDADTAELVVTEFGHKIKRVSEADVEIGL